MKFITADKITVSVIPEGSPSSYNLHSTSLLVKKDNVIKRYTPSSIDTSINFCNTPFPDDGLYLLELVTESDTDLDKDGVAITETLYRDTVYKVKPETKIEITI